MSNLFRFRSFIISGFLLFVVNVLQGGAISSGVWVKLEVNNEGVYRIGYQELKAYGFDVSAINPKQIKLLGHQGGMLPESNGLHTAGLPEIPIFVVGESDGSFDAGDYILFYAGGLNKWTFNSGSRVFEHKSNIYSNHAYFYLGVSQGDGLRVQTKTAVTQNPDRVTDNYTWVSFHDSDIYNPISMGRIWIGEKMGNETMTRNFSVALPSGLKDSAFVKLSFAGGMKEGSGSVRTNIYGLTSTYPFGPINEEYEGFQLGQRLEYVKIQGSKLDIGFELIRPNSQSSAWVNFYEINAQRTIPASEAVMLRDRVYTLTGITETRIPGSGAAVWDVTDEMNPVLVNTVQESTYTYFRTNQVSSGGPFAVFYTQICPTPYYIGKINNQDILAGDPADMIIVSHSLFLNQAKDLASFRQSHDGLKVKVVTPEEIYAEYSTGQQDVVAIRDYLKAEYSKSAFAGGELKYVLLFGSTSFDPKNRVANNTNFIPVYQSPSVYKSQTYCLDDFYAYFDTAGGNPAMGKNKMWLSVGRLPVRTTKEAEGVVNKLKKYAGAESLGPWRSDITFISDDVDERWEAEFVQESEKYAGVIDKGHPDLLISKIYADAYKQQSTGNTEKYPDVSSAIDRTMQNGSLFINYQGHGGEKGWAQEAILTVPMIKAWSNKNNMPVLFTATCEFSRFDDPAQQSGGELSLLNPNGGAIALMSTTRLVFVSGNSQINYDFWTNYGFPKPNEPVPTVGDLYKKMKNRPSTTSEDNKFALLGDPSMTMAFPEHKVVIDSINGRTAQLFTDTVKAFAVVKIKGHIDKRLGGKFNNFNGKMWVKVFDKPQKRFTLDNDNNGIKTPFKDENSYIFKGTVTVTNGGFEVVFPVPKDISYVVDSARMAFYAHNGEEDANGAFKVMLGGSLDQIVPDHQGPKVSLFMNDTTFIYGGTVQKDAVFIARVSDESGLNTTGAGIGRDMVAILDEGTSAEKQFILNDYFNYNLNSYTVGMVHFPMQNIAVGEHVITFKAWDIHNNSVTQSLKFKVLPEEIFEVTSHTEFPNPFRDQVEFRFTHNLSGEDILARLNVYDQSGRQIQVFEQKLDNALADENRFLWDGYDSNRRFCGPGFYIFRIDLEANDGRKTSFKGKIIKN